jgi:hypothetical protein
MLPPAQLPAREPMLAAQWRSHEISGTDGGRGEAGYDASSTDLFLPT